MNDVTSMPLWNSKAAAAAASLSRERVREYDRRAIERGVLGPVLMENAGRGAVELLTALGASGPISIVCGKGNNGGDGFVMARLLAGLGRETSVELLHDPMELTGDAATAFAPLRHSGIPIRLVDGGLLDRLRRSQWIVDALLGTGIHGPVGGPYLDAIERINRGRRRVLAVDIPSGLDADLGRPLGAAVRADHTATFVARKCGFDNPESRQYTGLVHVVDIGAAAAVVNLADR